MRLLGQGWFTIRVVQILFWLTWTASPHAHAQFKEIKSFQEVPAVVQPDSLVILDLDNTVFETHQTLGCDEWFSDLIRQRLEIEMEARSAYELACQEWTEVQNHAPMKPVEESTPDLIREFQKKGNQVIGLTARSKELSDRTVQQLLEIGVNFRASSIPLDTVHLDEEKAVIYQDGIIFVGETRSKGNALARFFNHHQIRPQHVVFVDDKHYHTKTVEKLLETLGIEHLVLRYSATDEKTRNYRRDIANAQWHFFKTERKLISDEEALRYLNQP